MSASSSDIPAPVSEQEPAELARFREQWKAEVRERRAGAPAQPSASARSTTTERAASPARSDTSTKTVTATTSNTHSAHRGLPRPATHAIAGAPNVPVPASHGQSHLSPTLAHAIEVYRNAVLHEQRSQLDEALRLYRQAFRLDPNVDRAYFKEHELSAASSSAGHKKTSSTAKAESVARGGQPENLDAHEDNDKDKIHVTSEFLAQVIKNFPEHLVFAPEDEKEGRLPINLIPDELLLRILRILDYTTVEQFATVSRKARTLSLDSAIWRYGARLLHVHYVIKYLRNRDFVHLAYKPPQIPDDESLTDIVKRYDSDYRRAYIEHPRLRLDGVYIAVCHYV
jgi:F-box protein 9